MRECVPVLAPIPLARPQAVLWDMDGTLVDSERLWDVSLAELARELGGELSTATVDRLLHHAHLCQTSGESVRLSQALTGQGVKALT